MFDKPFSFKGRIRRTEYGLTLIISTILNVVLRVFVASVDEASSMIFLIFLIPLLWFSWGQGAKRCHDLGNSGWFQIIPFYVLWMLFQDGEKGANRYGQNPKGVTGNFSPQTLNSPTPSDPSHNHRGYGGDYNGGHNNPGGGTFQTPTHSANEDNSGYKSGELYK